MTKGPVCIHCKGDTNGTVWGPWCDDCGGVYIKPDLLLFRHVATVYGPGGRFPIVFDQSTQDYAYCLKDPHPEDPNRDQMRDVDGFHPPAVRVVHGTLDAVIALAYPDVRGTSPSGPEAYLAAAPSATHYEHGIVLGSIK